MVFQDISHTFKPYQQNGKKSAALLMDRFFSFLIDYLVISPFVFFFLYIIFGEGFNYWRNHPQAPENESFLLIAAISFVGLFGFVQSLFISVWKATPGQYFLKIELSFHESESLIFFRAFLRQSAFWLSFLFLGIPFLSLLTNKWRRTFYDRLADTTVLSRKNEHDFFVFEKEYNYWQAFMATLTIFLVFLGSTVIWKGYENVVNRTASFNELFARDYFCKSMSNVELKERLLVAVGLNLVNQLSDECLDLEADFVLWKQKKSDYSLAYYAKSLTTNNLEKENEYLNQACDGQNIEKLSSQTFGCKIARSFLNNSIDELYFTLNENNFLNDVLKYELSLILEKTNDVETNFAKIEKYSKYRLVKKYQVLEMLARADYRGPGRQPAAAKEHIPPLQSEKIIKLIGEL